MTAPRQIVRGRIYLITRRCSERRYFLRPDAKTTALFLYALAEAAQRFGLRVIGWLAMSNHYHAIVEDLRGDLPAFLCHFHKMSARSLNTRWGRSENLWAAEQASVVRLVQSADVLDKTVYALVNPIAAHLVERMFDWPGATSFLFLDGRTHEIERPRTFYRAHGTMPKRIVLRANAPTGWPGGDDAWNAALRAGVEARVRVLNEKRRAAGIPVVGRRAVLAMSPDSKPTTVEAGRRVRPEIACLEPIRRMAEISALARFRAAYAEARIAFIATFSAIFPWGTYKLARELGARSMPAPAS